LFLTWGEFKTKPTQHSVRTLQGIGLQPDVIICRAEKELPASAESKIALFCNVPESRVISNPDIPVIYRLPLSFEDQDLGSIFESPSESLVIAMPGKYTTLSDSYKSINEALSHAAAACDANVMIKWIETEERCDETSLHEDLHDVDAVLLTPGFGERGVEGMICTATLTFNLEIPLLGICYGAQLGTVAFARKMMDWKGAHTTEVDADSLYPVIDLMDEQKTVDDKGGTMRLGGHEVSILEGTKLHEIYGKTTTRERFRHRFHLIDRYINRMKEQGLIVSAYDTTGEIINAIELVNHPFWIGVQFHPEFKSRPDSPHPLYLGLIRAALEHKKQRGNLSGT
jgi:CTP synthase